MNPASSKPLPSPSLPPAPIQNATRDVKAWRDAAFWSLLLAGLGAGAVLAALDNPAVGQLLLAITTHAKTGEILPAAKAASLTEHIRWWLIALPLTALAIRWVPLSNAPGETKRCTSAPGFGSPAEATAGPTSPTSPTSPPLARPASEQHPPAQFLRLPPILVGVFALQLVLGAGCLTGTWSYIRDQFWFPTRASDNEIRDEFLPRGTMSFVRHINRVLPTDADIYLLADFNASPSLLNYYLYPRRLYNSEGPAGFLEQADSVGFWMARRSQGFHWVLLYHPWGDPVTASQLIELPPLPPSRGRGSPS